MAEITTFELVKKWAELAYLLSGTGLLIIASFGLYQIKLAKSQLESAKNIFRKQSIRASYETAANECNRFSEKYFPLKVELEKFLREEKISFFKDAKVEESDGGFRVNYESIKEEELKSLSPQSAQLCNLLNTLEGFALYIVSGVADDDIAFHTLGKAFVEEAEYLSKILPFLDIEQDDCKAIWALYFKWKRRIDHHKLQVEKAEIEKRLKKAKVEKFVAIGTEKA